MIKVKRILCVLFLSFIIFLTSCFQQGEFEYLGSYPELFSVAINSLLGARGFYIGGSPGSGGIQLLIRIDDEDEYGRILFLYRDDFFLGEDSRVIMQKIDGDYAYFYPHYNFILRSRENINRFTDEDIEVFKKINSWNQEMSDSSEFVRVRITRQKKDGLVSNDRLIETFLYLFPNTTLTTSQKLSNVIFLRDDNYGRSIYSIGMFIILFQFDYSLNIETGILEITDRYNYQSKLRLFMETNGWNTPFEERLENEE